MPTCSRTPVPDLRIVPAGRLYAHESQDSQRYRPLLERFRSEQYIINPPVVAPMDAGRFVILDGANRCHALRALGYPHLPVQVVTWESGQVVLDTWNHVVSDWTVAELLAGLRALPGLTLQDTAAPDPVAEVQLADGRRLTLTTTATTDAARNALLCRVVALYQENASLFRSVLGDLTRLQEQFPGLVALLRFPRVEPAAVVAAARQGAWLPPGVSRHIIHGRALRINYPVRLLADKEQSLEQKNAALRAWLRRKLAQRQLRFYAESTWQFDEEERA